MIHEENNQSRVFNLFLTMTPFSDELSAESCDSGYMDTEQRVYVFTNMVTVLKSAATKKYNNNYEKPITKS